MPRAHALVISVAIAFSVAAGGFAALRTTQLGSSPAPSISPTAFARETQQLRRTQAALERALRRRPPKLPPLPRPAVAAAPVAPAPAPALAPVATTVRSAPVVRTSSSPAAGRSEREGGGDGGSFDD